MFIYFIFVVVIVMNLFLTSVIAVIVVPRIGDPFTQNSWKTLVRVRTSTSTYRLCLPMTRPYKYLEVAFSFAHDQSVVVFYDGFLHRSRRVQNNKTEERIIRSVRCEEIYTKFKNIESACKFSEKHCKTTD
jgi:hypothetical protein